MLKCVICGKEFIREKKQGKPPKTCSLYCRHEYKIKQIMEWGKNHPEVILVIVTVVGVIFLGLIFLIKGVDVVTLLGSLGWIIVGAVILIYHISKKEEVT